MIHVFPVQCSVAGAFSAPKTAAATAKDADLLP
jgi:hypothetical protein